MRRSCMVMLLAATASIVMSTSAWAEVRLPKIFGNGMVIQQQQPIKIWGWADAGEKIDVKLACHKATTTADKDGKWAVSLEPFRLIKKPVQLTVTGTNTITLSDVLIGEVWVCSGQSNMQWSVSRALNPQEEIAAAKYPKIRLFTVGRKPSEKPLDDCTGQWQACSETVSSFSAVGYFFGRMLHKELDVPVGLINSSWGGTICEAWTSRPTLEADPDYAEILKRATPFRPGNPNQGAALYNGMIHPIVPIGIRGAIWYQGESNRGRAQQYAKLFPEMITDWRKNWDQGDFSFLFVQLAPFRYGRADPRECAELWEAQFKTLALANTGMAVTTDIGNVRNIHPANKQEVGRRLALWALAKNYEKKDLVYSGPLYESIKVEGKKIRVHFKHAEKGLVAKAGPLTHFTIAAADEKFVPATATIDGETIVVESDQVAEPVAVRFAWEDTAEPNLFNQAGLPASPFRSDDFEMVTAGRQ